MDSMVLQDKLPEGCNNVYAGAQALRLMEARNILQDHVLLCVRIEVSIFMQLCSSWTLEC
jgi:hypothetical protein